MNFSYSRSKLACTKLHSTVWLAIFKRDFSRVKSHLWKPKLWNFCCPCAKWMNCFSIRPTWNIVNLYQTEQVCLWWLSLHEAIQEIKVLVSTDTQTRQQCKAESRSNFPHHIGTNSWDCHFFCKQFSQLLAEPLANPQAPVPLANPRVPVQLANPQVQVPLANPWVQVPLANPRVPVQLANPRVPVPLANPRVPVPLANHGSQYP